MNETEKDRVFEEEGIIRLAKLLGTSQYWIFPPGFPVDGLVRKDRIQRVVEFKRRNNRRDEWPTLKIDRAKIDHGLAIAGICNARFLLAIQWDDEFAARAITKQAATKFEVDTDWENLRGETDVAYCIPVRSDDWHTIP